MPIKRRSQILVFSLPILVILVIDQYSKSLACIKLQAGQSIPIVKNILHITLVRNTGAAFGLFKHSTLIFIAISIVAISFIVILILKSLKKGGFLYNPLFNSGLILIVAGAIGNLIDRLRFGYVIDFIDLRIWPIFNVADSSITVGTLLLILSFMRTKSDNFLDRH